jgi:hypothetical protein
VTQPDLPDWVSTISTADAPFLLQTWTAVGVPSIQAAVDISAFSSLNIVYQSASNTIDKITDIQINWFDKGNLIQTDHITAWGSHVANNITNPLTIDAPCRGDTVQILFSSEDAGVSISGFMFGSRRLIPKIVAQCDTQSCAPALLSIAPHALNPTVNETFFLGPTYTGWQLTVTSTAAGPLNVTYFAHVNAAGTFQGTIINGFNQAAGTVILAPVYMALTAWRIVFLNNGGAATNYGATILPLTL